MFGNFWKVAWGAFQQLEVQLSVQVEHAEATSTAEFFQIFRNFIFKDHRLFFGCSPSVSSTTAGSNFDSKQRVSCTGQVLGKPPTASLPLPAKAFSFSHTVGCGCQFCRHCGYVPVACGSAVLETSCWSLRHSPIIKFFECSNFGGDCWEWCPTIIM